MAASPGDKKVFDVAKPGKAEPSASARPLIVGHKPMIKDPMMSDTDKKIEGAQKENEAPLAAPKKTAITPIHESDEEETSEAKQIADADSTTETKVDKTDTAEVPAAAEENTPKPNVEKPAEKVETPPPPSDAPTKPADQPAEKAAEPDATAELQKEAKAKQDEAAIEAERQAHVKELIDKKTYAVSVSKARHGTSNATLVAVLILLLLAGGYIAADMGVFGNIELPFEVFKSQ